MSFVHSISFTDFCTLGSCNIPYLFLTPPFLCFGIVEMHCLSYDMCLC